MIYKFFPLSLTMRPNKLEDLPFETLSTQVLEFEGKADQTQLEDLLDASFLGKLLLLPANVRLDWKVIAKYKHSSLFGLVVSNEEKKFYNIDTRGFLIRILLFGYMKPDHPPITLLVLKMSLAKS